MDRLMLLDGNGLIYRGYFALPPLTTSKGELVNAVFGFCSIVLRGIQDIRPDYVAVAFDLPGPTFRHEQYAEYKATRQRMPDDLRDQFPKVREVVKALRIPVYELAGYEADDVIGTITVDAERRGLDTTIVTGDLDMLQLVTDHTRLMTTRSGVENTILYDPAKIFDRFELVPGPDDRLQGPQGRPDRQHPGRARRRREDRGEADPRVRHARRAVRADRRGQARQAAREARRAPRVGVHGPRPLDDRPRPARSSSTSRRPASATTTARPSSGSSASTSSAR